MCSALDSPNLSFFKLEVWLLSPHFSYSQPVRHHYYELAFWDSLPEGTYRQGLFGIFPLAGWPQDSFLTPLAGFPIFSFHYIGVTQLNSLLVCQVTFRLPPSLGVVISCKEKGWKLVSSSTFWCECLCFLSWAKRSICFSFSNNLALISLPLPVNIIPNYF